jgi:thymidylate kinase
MSLICSIEGHAFAGKTTLINHLLQKYGLKAVGEYDAYVTNTDEYPPHPHLSQEIALQDVDFFAWLDQKREKDIRKYSAQNSALLIDRSFLSLILFQKYTKQCKQSGEYDAYDYSKSCYKKLLLEDRLSLPDYMVYIKTRNLETHHSRLRREISSALLRQDDAYIFFNTEYKRVLDEYKKINRLLTLESDNTIYNLDENAKSINNISANPLTKSEKSGLIERIFGVI